MIATSAYHLEFWTQLGVEIWFGPFPLVPIAVRFGLSLLLHGTFHLVFSCRFYLIGVLRSRLALFSMSRIPGGGLPSYADQRCFAVGPQPCGSSAPFLLEAGKRSAWVFWMRLPIVKEPQCVCRPPGKWACSASENSSGPFQPSPPVATYC